VRSKLTLFILDHVLSFYFFDSGHLFRNFSIIRIYFKHLTSVLLLQMIAILDKETFSQRNWEEGLSIEPAN